MNVSPTQTVHERRMAMAARLGTARADHTWTEQRDGSCKSCGDRSPFRWERVAHPYVIEEEPF